ncbi:trans-sulfuration enzyme family protein [Paenibacillus sacheonensis]|uniref:homocysteine desulfhydrase n=1 Tax=Paenibacillus sacheonensis TaxID=742054 RepID=A0A7X4YT01_9BACL|nr:aminotransferase class I/II-fold pyridoxal phosphate-dependent enzyme [Paenibacillus sacheonensis]MBM7567075.1 cystathionine beta-lyase [Paenibacillus sacheonensis]NBC70994.1 aminotransferase class V-fold PLP-dependent enzyme [Paenibacillus sacheonensis]
MTEKNDREWQYTSAAHDAVDERHHGSINMPIYQTSLFAFETYDKFTAAGQNQQNLHVYSRGNNPTVRYLEDKLAELEQAEMAKCFASGMAAISAAILSTVRTGDHIVCMDQAYGPTRMLVTQYLQRFGIESTLVDGRSIDNIRSAIRPETKLLYLESPTSGMFQLQDLKACAELASSRGIVTIIDNSWATPVFQRPLELGIDLVVHSCTKYISGQSDSVAGVVLGSERLVSRIAEDEYMLFGGIMTAATAAQITRCLRTLPLRMERHERSALKVANHMLGQPYVAGVNHPALSSHPQHELGLRQMNGSSGLFSFESTESTEKMREWASRLKYFKIGVSWGGFESLVTVNPAGASCRAGARSLIRLHIGLESADDLIDDLDQTWAAVQDLNL